MKRRKKADRAAPVKKLPPESDRALNEYEAAATLAVSVHTLRLWRVQGNNGPPWRKIGRRVVYIRSEVWAFLTQLPMRGS